MRAGLPAAPPPQEESPMSTKEVDVDERGRTSLARVRSHDYDRYIAEELPDGTLILTPAVTISAVELAALRNPGVQAAITAAKAAGPGEFRPRSRRKRPAPAT
jgi:hypothetical protein